MESSPSAKSPEQGSAATAAAALPRVRPAGRVLRRSDLLHIDVAALASTSTASSRLTSSSHGTGEPLDISVDVIHRLARRQPRQDLGGVGGLDDSRRVDAVVPRGDRRGDVPDDTDDAVQAYMEAQFPDGGLYDTTPCFPKMAFFAAALVVLLVALFIIYVISAFGPRF